MLFSTPQFIFGFLPVALALFYLSRRVMGLRFSFFVLMGCSIFFYAWWRWQYVFLILGTIVFNYGVGLLLLRLEGRNRKAALAAGIAANLVLLGYFKYTEFLVNTLNQALGQPTAALGIVLPLGISFFAFQQISYLIDCYRSDAGTRNFLDYALFVLFFPHMIAGPIVRAAILVPQFHERRRERILDLIVLGGAIFLLGLGKKVFFADQLAVIADPVFAAAAKGEAITADAAWEATLAYSLQIYFDFSGYTDMAIGLAAMFGLRLPVNFDSPYKATSIVDFWRRWHITLSEWLRDYLYIPLGGSRNGRSRQYASLLITMLLGGLWHGAGWGFVIWGALHGIALSATHLWQSLGGRSILPPWLGRPFAIAATFFAVTFAWIFFRATNLDAAGRIFTALADITPAMQMPASPQTWALIAAGMIVVWFLPNTNQIFHDHWPAFEMRSARIIKSLGTKSAGWARFRPTAAWGVFLAVVAYACTRVAVERTATPFIYFQF